ncbi:MAG: DegV family protein [Candidatus Neomarinimicrobiota bacterium]
MECYEIDAKCLYNAFLSGKNEILRNKNLLDKINVFPVADGDTGTNLALTMHAVANSRIESTAGETLHAMADAALSGARGNSGIIFAEFIGGLSEPLHQLEKIGIHDFSASLKNAVKRAYNAISNPVEGTILSVLKDWTQAVETHIKLRDFTRILPETLKVAKKSLENTTNQLEVLKKANVVDAGAEGLFLFLKGFTHYFTSGRKDVIEADKAVEIEIPEHMHNAELPRYRYCTEAYLDENHKDNAAIRDMLGTLGDSLIVAGSGEKIRVHIHTNKPAEVFRLLSTNSKIAEQKVDDMLREYQVTQQKKYPIALVTDSVCDLPQDIFDQYQIHVIPMNINFDGNQYLDGITIHSDQIFQRIDKLKDFPRSSQPSPKSFRLLYTYLSSYYDSIIAIHVSSKLSNTFQLSKSEAEKTENVRISVIDSCQNSGAQGLLVLSAAKDIAEGKSHDEVVRNIEERRSKSKILVKVPNLKYMVRGGRVSPLKGLLAKITNLKPVVSLDEKGNSSIPAKGFSDGSARKKILELVRAEMNKSPLKYYAIVFGVHHPEVDIFEKELRALTGKEPLFRKSISPIIGLHAGPDTFAVVTMRE